MYFDDSTERKNLGYEFAKIIHEKSIPNQQVFFCDASGREVSESHCTWFKQYEKFNDKLPPKSYFFLRNKKHENADNMRRKNDQDLKLHDDDRLQSNNTVLMRKVATHAALLDTGATLTEEKAWQKYKLSCNGKDLLPDMDLRTIIYLIWTKGGSPIIYYSSK